MYKFEMFDALRKYNKTKEERSNQYKTNKTELPSSNSLIHSQRYDYYNKIDNYYPDGTARYFYTQAEWEAYLEGEKLNKHESNKKKKKEAEQKSNMTGYDEWQKKQELEKEYQKTDSYKQEQAKKKEQERVENVKKDIENANNKYTVGSTVDDRKSAMNEAAEILRNSTEGKAFETEFKKKFEDLAYFNKKYDRKFEDVKDLFLDAMMKTETYKKLNEMYDAQTGGSTFLINLYDELAQKYKREDSYVSNTKSREEAEQKAIKTTRLMSDDPSVVKLGVDMELDQFYKDSNVNWDRDKEKIINDYYGYLLAMNKLRKTEEIDPKSGFPKIANEMTLEETMEYVNPGRQAGIKEIQGGGNCRLCTLAMDLRSRGLDVSAPFAKDADPGYEQGIRTEGRGFIDSVLNLFSLDDDTYEHSDDAEGMRKMYKGDIKVLYDEDKNKLKESVSKQTNSYGFLSVSWNAADYGHAMFYTVDTNGKIEVYDAQINEKKDLDEIMDISHDWMFTRTDNLEPDYNYIKKCNWTVYY